MDNKKILNIIIEKDKKQNLKLTACSQGKTITEVVTNLIDKYIEENKEATHKFMSELNIPDNIKERFKKEEKRKLFNWLSLFKK